jgi:hypothetical protein
MSVSSFYGLQTSLRGLLAQQRSIDVTGHNIANASTRGYSRELGRKNQATVMRLRDSLIYRGEALSWHGSLIDWLQNGALHRLRNTFPDPNAPGEIVRSAAREQQFAFDDVVFNAIALFDYVGNTIGFAFYGDQRRKAKWDRIQKYARDEAFDTRDHANPRVSGTEVGELVVRAESELVAPLSDYRAALIHYETVPAGGGVTTRLTCDDAGIGQVDFELSITVPEPFAKRFIVPGHEADPRKAPLREAASWIAGQVFARSTAILRALEKDLRGEGGGDLEGTDRLIVMP